MADTINSSGFANLVAGMQPKVDQYVANIEALTSDTMSSVDAMVKAATNMTDANGDTALSFETRKLGELQAQEKMHDFYVAIGQDAEGAAKLTNKLGAQYNAAMQQTSELAHSVAQRKSVQMLDNPLGWLFNQIVLPDEEQALAGASQEAKIAADGIDRVNKMLNETAKNEQEYAQKLTAESVASQAEGMKNKMVFTAQQAKLHAQSLGAANLQAAMSANFKQLDGYAKVIELRNSEAHLRLAQQARADAHAQFLQWEKDVKDTAEANKMKAGWINASLEDQGKPPMDTAKINLFLTGKAPLTAELQAHMDRGFQLEKTGISQFGQNVGESVQFASATKVPVPDYLKRLAAEAKQELATEITAGKFKDQASVNAALSNKIEAKLAQYQQQIRPGDESNPYLLPSNQVIMQSEAVKGTKLYSAVLADPSSKGLDTRDVKVIFDNTMVAVQEGKLSQQEAIDGLYTYVKAGTIANSLNNQFYRWGVKESTQYKVNGVNYGDYTTLAREVIKRSNMYNLQDSSVLSFR